MGYRITIGVSYPGRIDAGDKRLTAEERQQYADHRCCGAVWKAEMRAHLNQRSVPSAA
jgi:hypothetical protein